MHTSGKVLILKDLGQIQLRKGAGAFRGEVGGKVGKIAAKMRFFYHLGLTRHSECCMLKTVGGAVSHGSFGGRTENPPRPLSIHSLLP